MNNGNQSQDSISPRQKARENGRNFAFLIGYVTALSAFGSFVNDMYLPTLPAMRDAFHCSASVVQLGLTFGMIGLGLGQLILGPVSDKYGRKPVLTATLILFCIASAASTFSPDIEFFIGCRFFQGLGASGGYFLARTIPADLFIGRGLAKVMALIGAINGIAPASAPVLGGLVAHDLGWRGIFWILFAFSAILLILTPKFKESLPKGRRNTAPLLQSAKRYFVLLKNKRFMTHVLLKGSALGILFAYISATPFIFQDHFHYTALEFGLFMGFNAIFVAVGSMVALKFKRLKKAALYGAIILGVAILIQIFVLWHGTCFWAFELLCIPMVLGLGMIFTTANTLAMNEGRQSAGDASAVLGLTGYVFGATVSPLVGMGNILHSTAIAFGVLSVITLLVAIASSKLPADLD